MLVGTAITGQSTRPPTALGKAPSIPATQTIASAPASEGNLLSSLWMPATPTSTTNETSHPHASAVTRASSATGRSLVPAVTTTTRPTLGPSSSGPATRKVRATG